LLDNDLAVLSPEKTILTYRAASLGSRIFAHVFDLFIVGILTYGVCLLAILLGMLTGAVGLSGAIVAISGSAIIFLYFILLEGLWNGQTVGKKVTNIRVRNADGTPIRFMGALGRNLLRPADMFPGTYFIGVIAMMTNPKSQRLGDLIANTIVVHEVRATPTFAPSPHKAGVHAFEDTVGRLRGMTTDEYWALRRFCDRYPELPTSIQNKLLEEVWKPIAARRGIPELQTVHPLYLAEATVMKYGREHGLL
jgi:uncharacterized RDD family membrane protein YckC